MRRRYISSLRRYERQASGSVINPVRAAIPNVATSVNSGMERLRDAAIQTGFIVNDVLAKEYRQRQLGRVDDSVLEAAKRFELWKAAYNDENQGKNALDALQDYSDAFEKISKEIKEEFDADGNEIFGELLDRKLAERGLSALREGMNWQGRQKEAWLASQMAAQLADFQAYVAANPDDTDGIAMRRQTVLESWKAKNPGLDLGETAAKLNGIEFAQRMEGFFSSGDLAGAKKQMAAYGRLAGLSKGASNSEWLLAHNNPGSVTVDGTNFAAYETPRDGYKAIMSCLNSYHKAGRKTLSQMISRYAPPKENDTAAYIREVAQWTGLEADKEVNVRDAQTLATLAGAIIRKEHSVTASPEELLAAAEDYLKTGRPKAVGVIWRNRAKREYLPGLDPASFQRYNERLRTLEAKAASEADQEKAAKILAEVQLLPIERRTMEILRRLEEIPDQAERDRLRPILKHGVEDRKNLDLLARGFALRDDFTKAMRQRSNASDVELEAMAFNMANSIPEPAMREDFKTFAAGEIKNRRDSKAANDAKLVEDFMRVNQGKSPAQIQQALALSDLSPEAKSRVSQLSWGLAKDENPQNLQALTLGLSLRDQGILTSPSDIQAFAAQNNLTLSQLKQLNDYKGNTASVSIQRVNTILKNLTALGDFAGPDQIDAAGYQILLSQIKPGAAPTEQELTELLSTLYMSNGRSWFFKKTVMDELAEEQFKMDWLPEIKAYQRPELEAILKQRDIRITENNLRQLLKLNIFHQLGFPTSDVTWDE